MSLINIRLNNIIKKFILLILITFTSSSIKGQEVYETLPPDFIKTIEFFGSSDEFSGTPIISINETLNLKFDDLTAAENDYYYEIEHYNFDWTPSKLSKNEYLEGFDNIRLFNFVNSFTTLQPYTHYELSFPNENTRGLKVSGNYMLKIFNSNKELLFSRKFIVFENLVNVDIIIRRSRNLTYLDKKQVVNFEVGRDDFIFRNPEQTVNTVVVQNNDFNTAIYDLKPQFTQGNRLIYRYDEESSFWGGNEYFNFDNKDIRQGTLRIERVELDDLYNSFLYPNFLRAGNVYTFYPDINGAFRINTIQGDDIDIESEYAKVHFTLQNSKDLENGEIHLYGRFNNYVLDDSTLMKPLESQPNILTNELLLKQGFYNYKYVFLDKNGNFKEGFISGNHDVTENDYQVIVYYRDIGARFDRVIGTGFGNSENIIN
ncbi:type IX secretion system plug protein [Psychroflexus lacisalsi]|jgi:hypothetical protein|uniref:DUF5103 domain-containing protein n=1 Tax=Psychroflexus lacisalsi TaxID=503928 RepID=A0ABN1K681_9FLAO|nr:DUF5103 domain-containing protein [Psychroflexus lacisalsi]MBZ9619238.1 DUF5103 domain-containing protein [Psychroflexus lacisalsi]